MFYINSPDPECSHEIWKQIDMIMTLYFLYVFCMQLFVFF